MISGIFQVQILKTKTETILSNATLIMTKESHRSRRYIDQTNDSAVSFAIKSWGKTICSFVTFVIYWMVSNVSGILPLSTRGYFKNLLAKETSHRRRGRGAVAPQTKIWGHIVLIYHKVLLHHCHLHSVPFHHSQSYLYQHKVYKRKTNKR